VIVEGTVEVMDSGKLRDLFRAYKRVQIRRQQYGGPFLSSAATHRVWIVGKKVHQTATRWNCMSKNVHVFATCAIGPAVELLRQKGYEVDVYPDFRPTANL